MKKTTFIRTAALLIALFALRISSLAQSGLLDQSFDNDGIVTTPIGTADKAFAVTTQTDGKIVVAGESYDGMQLLVSLTRYNINGSLDLSFGNNGIVTTQIGTNDYGRAVAIQADGKIVVAGYSIYATQFAFALVRYNTNGSIDNSFGNNGIVITAIGNDDYGRAVAIQADGKIVVAGSSAARIVVTRYNTDGSLDANFGNNGIVITPYGTYDHPHAVAIQPNGKIVVGAYTEINSQMIFTVLRYNTNGSLDASFDSDGITSAPIGVDEDRAYSLVLQSDGKIVLAGNSKNGSLHVFALARFNTNGSLDTGFDNDGIVMTPVGTNDDRVYGVAIQADGKIVAGGYSNNGSQNVFALTRYNTNGSLDTSFNTNGIVTTDIGNDDVINSVTIQSDGRILVAGYSYFGGQYVYALARYYDCTISTFSQSLTICAGQTVTVGNNTYTTNGTYIDTLTAINACDSIVTTTVIVNPMPILTTYLGGNTVISNQNGATYQWIQCNNNNLPIAGETNQAFTATVNGSYAVIVTLGSCSDTSACVNIFNVGMAQLSNAVWQMSVYPNPFSSSTTIQTNQVLNNATLTVYNSLGEQIKQIKDINGQSIFLTRDNLTNGFYFIQLTQDNKLIATNKLVLTD